MFKVAAPCIIARYGCIRPQPLIIKEYTTSYHQRIYGALLPSAARRALFARAIHVVPKWRIKTWLKTAPMTSWVSSP